MQGDIHSLLAKYFSGQASAGEAEAVKNWAGASEENAGDFALLEKLWSASGEPEEQIFDASKAWQTVHAKLQQPARVKVISIFTRRAMIAAAIIILLLSAWWLFVPGNSPQTISADIAMKEVTMNDGSKIFLRQGATISYAKDYGKKNRAVSLRGEAFFEVKPDASLPFIIDAAEKTSVEVVGTSFLVNTKNNEVSLFVRTGRVSFSASAEKILVTAGEKALYAGDRLVKENNANENYDAWRTKQLVFSNTTMREVVKDIGNYYGITIGFKAGEEDRIGATTISTRFNDASLQMALNDLSTLSNYNIKQVRDAHFEISIK